MSDLEYYLMAFICAVILIAIYMDQTGMIDSLDTTALSSNTTTNSTGGTSAPRSPFHTLAYVQPTGDLV